MEPALRAVLGDQLDAVIVESPLFALRAIEILKETEWRTPELYPGGIGRGGDPCADRCAGITGRLIDLVEVEPASRRWPRR